MEITIHVYESSAEEGYGYDIYLGSPEEVAEGLQAQDGGLCLGSEEEAIKMAAEEAKDIAYGVATGLITK